MRKRAGETGAGGRAAAAAFALLAALYAATAAPEVTFWDAGEFVAAFRTLGVPHPPGTPLLVLLGRAWDAAVGGWLGAARAAAMLAALCTAATGALAAALIARWTGSARAALAAAVCAGATSSVWASATEAEAYATAVLLSWIAVACADVAGRRDDARWLALAAYALALAVPLHLSALVALPAVVLLAAGAGAEGWSRGAARALVVGGAGIAAAGAGRVSATTAAAGVVALLAGAWLDARARGTRPASRTALLVLVAIAVGVSGVLAMLVRARLDPPLNQGDASTWGALADVLARRQYAVAAPWPRQAPWWLQLGNVFQWADWQFAYGVAPYAEPSVPRTLVTAAYALLGVAGSRWHRLRDARSWRALLALLLAGSVGVAAYLNLKAGPSFGWGVIPDDAPHEARERDYFFLLAWWAWGLWAGMGALAVASHLLRARRGATALGAAAVALPIALNWRAATRRALPDARIPAAFARALLASVPPDAVLFVNGDNDTYPVWHAQLVDGARRDVATVTVPLLGASWYRRELARRHRLLGEGGRGPWLGDTGTVVAIAREARRLGRPVAVSAAAPRALRAAIGGRWALAGLAYVRVADDGDDVGRAPGLVVPGLGYALDTAAARRAAAAAGDVASRPARAGGDGVTRWAHELLRCPALALAMAASGADEGAAASLDASCNRK